MFATESNGIEFSANRKPANGDKNKKDQEVLIPATFKESHLSVVDGTILCDIEATCEY